ncbi:hypothetical protein ABKN59_009433 [Abortiporus biennis]
MSNPRVISETGNTPRLAEGRSSQFKLSQILKKVSNFRPGKKVSSSNGPDLNDSTRDAARFAARSAALGRKSFGFSQPTLSVHPASQHRRRMSETEDDTSDGSPSEVIPSNVPSSAPVNGSFTIASTHITSPSANGNAKAKPTQHPSRSTTPIDGLPTSSTSHAPFSLPPSIPLQVTPNPSLSERQVTPEIRSQTLPSRRVLSPSLTPAASPSTLVDSPSSSPLAPFQTTTPKPSNIADPKSNLHLRLASLPPPMMLRYTTEGSARLTPSFVVGRQLPMPLLNLPTLSSPGILTGSSTSTSATTNTESEGRGERGLRSMPALPLTGPRDDENPEMDEEDVSDDDSDLEDGDEGMESARDGGVSEDEDDGASSIGIAGRGSSLPQVATSPFEVPFLTPKVGKNTNNGQSSFASGSGSRSGQQRRQREKEVGKRPSTQYFTPTQEYINLPNEVNSTTTKSNPTLSQLPPRGSSLDYFSSRMRELDHSLAAGESSATADPTRTPRPADFRTVDHAASSSVSSTSRTPVPSIPPIQTVSITPVASSSSLSTGPGMIPRIVAMPPTPASPLPPSLSSTLQHTPALGVKEGKGKLVGTSTITKVMSAEGMGTPSRPGFYHQTSRSMIDLSTFDRNQQLGGFNEGRNTIESECDGKTKVKKKRLSVIEGSVSEGPGGDVIQGQPTQTDHLRTPTIQPHTPQLQLRRQRSLPTYSPRVEPPPYMSLFLSPHLAGLPPPHPLASPNQIILPREEEGRESLPPYSNSIYLIAMMPRKMEFTAPNVQAKERRWKRVIVVLEGTMLKIYKTHGAGHSQRGGKVGELWEWAIGVGDWSVQNGTASTAGTQGRAGEVLRVDENGSVRVRRESRPPARKDEDEEEVAESPVLPTSSSEITEERRNVNVGSPPNSAPPTSSNSGSNSRFGLTPPSSSTSRRSFDTSRPDPSISASNSTLGIPTSASNNSRTRLSFDSPRERDTSSIDIGPGRRSMDALSATTSSSRITISSSTSTMSTSASSRSFNQTSSASSSFNPTNGCPPRSQSRASSVATAQGQGHHRGHTPTPSVLSSLQMDPPTIPALDEKDLLRIYTLQNAESGLASDYVKRKNVIRLRLEGEQFLLQARDVANVIEWIEGIQSATNVALDLDERPMPKGPLFPRRRRRRQRRTEASTSQANATATSGTGDQTQQGESSASNSRS